MTSFWHAERSEDGSVTYTGLLPAAIAMTFLFVGLVVCATICIAAFALAVRVVEWAFAA